MCISTRISPKTRLMHDKFCMMLKLATSLRQVSGPSFGFLELQQYGRRVGGEESAAVLQATTSMFVVRQQPRSFHTEI